MGGNLDGPGHDHEWERIGETQWESDVTMQTAQYECSQEGCDCRKWVKEKRFKRLKTFVGDSAP